MSDLIQSYKLLKALPDLAAGAIFELEPPTEVGKTRCYTYAMPDGSYYYYTPRVVELSPDFFEPIISAENAGR
jgi:hypothetical protein